MIDRRKIVLANNPRIRRLDPFSALTVGNGTFAFTADVTGLQTFSELAREKFPLCTAAGWAWHSAPAPAGARRENFRYQLYRAQGRSVGYPTDPAGQEPLFHWMRQNPHRLHLGRIAFDLAGPEALRNLEQTLDLWTGTLISQFEIDGNPLRVTTCCHPRLDLLAVRVECRGPSPAIVIEFPYGSPEIHMADWNSPAAHRTFFDPRGRAAEFRRTVDDAKYFVRLRWSAGRLSQKAEHRFALAMEADPVFEMVAHFSAHPHGGELPGVDQVLGESASNWPGFWNSGAAIDLSGSSDTRAGELQRRIILSQYNTALHCAAEMPAQETGLLFNTWYGKFHLEMHWWHIVHFSVWNRFAMFARSLGIYRHILPKARQTARRQGYAGARWPKMVGPDGLESPSPIGPLLIWQQPHPIYFAEVCYRREPSPKTLNDWKEIVYATADFMASYAAFDAAGARYNLGPPLMTVSENTKAVESFNPTFELSYWRMGLRLAQEWRTRVGAARDEKWDDVLHRLATPATSDGVYLLQEAMADTYSAWNWEHPALVGALGMLPGDGIDPGTMRQTVRRVMEQWQWNRCWGWDFAMTAMAAARADEPALAIDALMIDAPANTYLPNGHNYQAPGLPAYLPGNAALLAAVAMMAGGWTESNDGPAPGFPRDGKWTIIAEGFDRWL